MRIARVSAFLPDITQQIHSLRASGVMSSHNARSFGEAESAFRKSAGSTWMVPGEIVRIINEYYQMSSRGVVTRENTKICDLTENRTPINALKRRCPNR